MHEDLEAVLEQLADETRPVRSIDLSRLSDLPRSEADRFDLCWTGLSAARRLEAVVTMVERAEANIHLNFHAILRQCLSDTDGQIRRLAVDGLWEDEKPSLIGRLVTLLENDAVADVRAAAASSLGRFVLLGVLGEISEAFASQAEAALQVAWERADEPTEVRRRALEGLAYASHPAVGDLIEAAYRDNDRLMRHSAVFAMGRSGDRRWSRSVLAELQSHDAAMRFEAAVSAGELGLSAAVHQLVHLMNDADSSIREAAAMALGKIGGREAKRALEEAVQGADEGLSEAAEEALDELVFNSSGFERSLNEGGAGSWQRLAQEMDDEEDEDFDDEYEGDARLSEAGFMEDEGSWDAEEDEVLDWFDQDEENDDDFGGADPFSPPARHRPSGA